MITLGLDIGSTTCKGVILQGGSRVLATSLMQCGIGTKGVSAALAQALQRAQLSRAQIDKMVVTGYGRTCYEGADQQASEITCHALGAHFTFPQARTVIDIGGQDAKVIALHENGTMKSFLMNDKCAAGTGLFLEVMARIMQIPMEQMGPLALQATQPVKISSTCTVFAESEVISQLAANVQQNDLLAGICDSVAGRVGALAQRVGVQPDVCLSGGVAKNSGVQAALERILHTPLLVAENAQLFGALGAALYGYRSLLKEQRP